MEMIGAGNDTAASMTLAASISHDGKVPSDLEQSFISVSTKGKGDALGRVSYCSLKLTEQVMKVSVSR